MSKSEIKEQRDLLQLPDNYFKIIFDNFNECDNATIKKEVEKVVFTSYVLMISQGLKKSYYIIRTVCLFLNI